MNLKQANNIYFIGIGGIGMSALARYFVAQGKNVSGYDKTSTWITEALQQEGIPIHFDDTDDKVLEQFDFADTLVVYTPAVPKTMGELNAFHKANFKIMKRAEVLGMITNKLETFAVAGTHGKTTTAAILAHVLNQTEEACNAFIGGITSNYNSNSIINANSKRVVVEADEFDRSFLRLNPSYVIVTSVDADHLDIYESGDNLSSSFGEFINLTANEGHVLLCSKIDQDKLNIRDNIEPITYGCNDSTADWNASNIRYEGGLCLFDVPDHQIKNIEFGIPGEHNVENALAVLALCSKVGVSEEKIRKGLKTFKGVRRRFDVRLKTDSLVIIDDYAHHPTEITAFLSSVRKMYPNKEMTVVFQPHLYSRTRDFMNEFARALSMADRLYLLDIYPAREEPIPGITSEVLLQKVELVDKELSSKENITFDLGSREQELILIVGAGDIDTCVEPIVKAFGGSVEE